MFLCSLCAVDEVNLRSRLRFWVLVVCLGGGGELLPADSLCRWLRLVLVARRLDRQTYVESSVLEGCPLCECAGPWCCRPGLLSRWRLGSRWLWRAYHPLASPNKSGFLACCYGVCGLVGLLSSIGPMLRQVFGWSAGATSIVVCCNFLPHDASVLDAHRRTSVVGEFFGGELGEANICRLVTHGVQYRLNTVFRNACRTLQVALLSPSTFRAGSWFW
ncbi:hypothetical protein IGI04_003608, partial [Brassica rapa subsp. trilocularis]